MALGMQLCKVSFGRSRTNKLYDFVCTENMRVEKGDLVLVPVGFGYDRLGKELPYNNIETVLVKKVRPLKLEDSEFPLVPIIGKAPIDDFVFLASTINDEAENLEL